MVTPDELRNVPPFAELEEPDLEWLCRVMADISLSPGEFAVHDGDSPASSLSSTARARRSRSSTVRRE
jgi:hypothetical protein